MAVNKVIYGGQSLIDLTGDTVAPDKVLTGFTTHDKSGEQITGTCPFDVDSGDATVAVSEVLVGKSAYARGAKIVGTMPNRAGAQLNITKKTDELTIAQGYHDGSGKAKIDSVEAAKIIGSNIRQGVEILNVVGTLRPSSDVTSQVKIATPQVNAQTILPDAGFDYLSQVTVNAIPYVETANAAGGLTVTIAG